MKKRLISLLVALCMAVTLLPVSALTAWAEEGGQLKIVKGGYPEGSNSGSQSCSGTDWSYDKDTRTLTLSPSTPTNYDFSNNGIHTGPGNNTDCNLIIGQHATVTDGFFWGAVTNHGTITGGFFSSSVSNESNGKIENGQFGDRASSCTVTNNGGTINGGTFKDELTGSGIEPGYTLKAKTPTGYEGVLVNEYRDSCYIIPNQASVSVDIIYHFEPAINFQNLPPLDVTIDNAQPTLLSDLKIEFDGHSAYKVTFTAPPANGSTVTISPLTRLVIDKDGYPATAQDRGGNRADYSGNGWKFDASNNTLTLESGDYDFSGSGTALRPLNPDVQLVVEPGAKLTGGAAGDGSGVTWQLTENTDDPSTYKLTISGSGAMKNFPFGSDQPWYSFKQQITSVVIHPGVTSIGECAFSWFPKLTHVDIADSVISIGGNAFKSCSSLTDITIPQRVTHIGGLAFSGCTSLSSITLSNNITSIGNAAFKNCTNLTSITIPSSVTSIGSNVFDGCTSLNDIRYSGTSESVISALSGYVPTLVTFDYGDKVPEAERMIKVFVKTGGTLTAPTTLPNVVGYEFKGWLTEDGELYDFPGAPTGQLTLYANWEKIPDPKPEPEAPTYTLTVKGGTFTYNGGEAMTSASVPVDAEVKVTLNQSAVPEGMVFDLWAMDEASLLGNPAVAYNEESFTIPAGSVAKGSTVTVEAQYRDATIESEPSILGTAAIIGVAGAGTAVIVWQGYRIGMELYEKYFQPTPEETAAEQPAPEAPAAAAAS
ncbi:leucine-rich repeat domain-containing protein [Faecalibacterium duncaniae]|uniref:leucine-rich repeat domain-containing protein n=1 Tax=Faecalibacterium duncaniae (strain DSM 17677 / JCM 31915 / A2-165) TaxID=411483 RepID=UPI00209FE941|nr:leucine-rich repeat domain-containing protein [Faecalibacterium duncaniae]UTB40337.1 leucine-rich repeat protein [Faecalibacterium duncaniae]